MQAAAANKAGAARPVLSAQLRCAGTAARAAPAGRAGTAAAPAPGADGEVAADRNTPQRLDGQDFKAESERIEKTYKDEEAKAYAELDGLCRGAQFHAAPRSRAHGVHPAGQEGAARMTEDEMLALPKERRAEIEQAEQELRAEITRYFEKTRPLERAMNEALAALRRQVVKPLLDHELQEIRIGLKKQIKDSVKLGAYLDAGRARRARQPGAVQGFR